VEAEVLATMEQGTLGQVLTLNLVAEVGVLPEHRFLVEMVAPLYLEQGLVVAAAEF